MAFAPVHYSLKKLDLPARNSKMHWKSQPIPLQDFASIDLTHLYQVGLTRPPSEQVQHSLIPFTSSAWLRAPAMVPDLFDVKVQNIFCFAL